MLPRLTAILLALLALLVAVAARQALMPALLLVLITPMGYAVWRLLWPGPGGRLELLTGLLLAPVLALAALLAANLAGTLLHETGAVALGAVLTLSLAGLLWLVDDLARENRNVSRWLQARAIWLPAAALVLLLGIVTTMLPNRFLGGADDGGYTSTVYSFYARGGVEVRTSLVADLGFAVDPSRFLPISYVPVAGPGGRAVPIHPLGFPLMAAPLYESAVFLGAAWQNAVFMPYQMCGLLAAILLLVLGRDLAGGAAALLAVLLLQLNWLQAWLARSAFGEVPLQVFSLAVLWLLVRARRYPDLRWLPVAVLLAAAAATIKIEGLILLLLLAPLALASPAATGRRLRAVAWLAGMPALLWLAYLLAHPGFLEFYLAQNIMPVLVRYLPALAGGA